MKTQKRKSNRQSYGRCLTIIIFAFVLFLPLLGSSYIKLNKETHQPAELSKQLLSSVKFGSKKNSSTGMLEKLRLSKHAVRNFTRPPTTGLHAHLSFSTKSRFSKSGLTKRPRNLTKSKRIRLVSHTGPAPAKFFAMLGSAVQMQVLHFCTNAVLPAEENWKYDLDSLLQPYINGMEAYDSILVAGFTDNSGSKQANLQLSAQRAKNVAAQLAKLGIPENRIHVVAMGEDYPVSSNKISNGRDNNRRVEINFLKAD